MNTSKTAVITGAGSGVGRATAIQMVADGWRVALLGRRQEALEETVRLTGNPDACLPIACDVGDSGAVLEASQQVLATFGAVEVLVNAAGTNAPTQ